MVLVFPTLLVLSYKYRYQSLCCEPIQPTKPVVSKPRNLKYKSFVKNGCEYIEMRKLSLKN